MNCIEQVVQSGLCIGCGACTLLAPPGVVEMIEAENGFLEPEVRNEHLIKQIDAIFASVCPGQRVDGPSKRDSVTWGSIQQIAAGHATNPAVRFDASSGGVLTALCTQLLESGQVDAVITLGPNPDQPLRPIGRIARTCSELAETAGSRYCPSSPVALLAQLQPGERAAFLGKPCDVAAVRQLARNNVSSAQQVQVTLSFFCAGIPSFEATDALVRKLGHEPDDVASFRYRGEGWPGRAASTDHTGETLTMSYEASWGGVLTTYRHERCKICPDASGELADIACGDAWHDDGFGPKFDDAPGRSVVISRTTIGVDLVSKAEALGTISLEPYDAECLDIIQQYQVERKRSIIARLIGRRLMGSPVPAFKKLGLLRASRSLEFKQFILNVRGSASRARRDHPKKWHRIIR